MEYPEKEEGKVLIGTWVKPFDKATSVDLNVVLGRCDVIYALNDDESFESLKRRVSASKAKAFPDYVVNDQSAVAWLVEKYGEDGFTYITPEAMASFTGLDEKFNGKMEDYRQELKKRLPKGVTAAMDNLSEEILKMQKDREEIFERYVEACKEQEIGPEQARDELELYIRKKVPADELLAPVGMCKDCLLYTSPSPRDVEESRMPSSA